MDHDTPADETKGAEEMGEAQTKVEAKHTAGPWEVVGSPLSGFSIYGGPDDSPVVWEMGGIDNEANAHLIAAAPDLLEALGEVLSTGLNGGNNYRLAMMAASRNVLSDETLERAEASERAVTKAYAAINKALGKEQP